MALSLAEALDWYPINLALSSRAVMHNLLDRLHDVLVGGVPGDVVEMGCHAGDTSVFLARMIRELDPSRTLHLYDSFQGLPEKDAKDNPAYGEPGSVRTAEEVVRARFAQEGLPPPQIHAGWFAELAEAEFPRQIAFAFFDGDLYRSIVDSFARVYPRLSPGAVVCVHDYGCDPWPGVTRACDDYLADKPERVTPACYLLGAMTKQ
ncbi:MAG TPA: TylF/MycF/NovP-related O-methyltransferase [Phycisphaerae bacterium]|nr:TylF/MycF/NovP-related O-methyltransferase [Phycisphaerae bacterium]